MPTPEEVAEDLEILGAVGLANTARFCKEGSGEYTEHASERVLSARFKEVFKAIDEEGGAWDRDGIRVLVDSHSSSNFTVMYAVGKLPKGTYITIRYEFGVNPPMKFGVGDMPSEIKTWFSDVESIVD